MVFEVQKGRECSKLVIAMEVEIQKGLDVEVKLTNELSKTQSQLVTTQEALGFSQAETKETKVLYNTQVGLTDHERGQKNRWKLATGFAILVIIGQIVFGG